MSNIKYANLPGFAADEPDCYETYQLPEDEQTGKEVRSGYDDGHGGGGDDDDDEQHENIEKPSINPKKAFELFAQHGNRTQSGSVYAACVPERDRVSENVLEKYERLLREFGELQAQVAELRSTGDASVNTIDLNRIENGIKSLNQIDFDEILRNGENRTKNSNIQQLDEEIEKFNEQLATAPLSPESGNDFVTVSLKCFPQKMKMQQNQRLVSLEQRLNRLEKVLGSDSTEKLTFLTNSMQNESLIAIADSLREQVVLLETKNLDFIEKRADLIIQKTNTIKEKAKLHENDDFSKKLNEVYEMVSHYGVIMKLLPNIISRFESLEQFHTEGSNMTEKFAVLQYNYEESVKQVEKLKLTLADVTKNFESNYQLIKDYIVKIENQQQQSKI